MRDNLKNNVIVILGPTSSGKSEVAIKLAKKFDGQVISADSRQIYRGLDIGTGKVRGSWNVERGFFISEKIPHYLIDIVSPKKIYNVTNFKKDADKIIKDILKRGKLPIICGGTGFWIKAVVDDVNFPAVKPNKKLRNLLRNKTAEELFSKLKKLDPERAKNIDAKNKVRLIRAIEICKAIRKVPALSKSYKPKAKSYNFLQIGMKIDKEKLYENIKKRLKKRFAAGMIEEVNKLKKSGLSWKKIQSFGLGYYWIPEFLKGEIKDKTEIFERILIAEKDYAKRQMTWFQKDKRIKWLKSYKEIEKTVDLFLKK